ncbi:MAG: flagellar hook-basal body protein [Planctomycetota bacterium]
MIDGIFISAAGALIQQARHDIAANNVANVNTVGFKKQLALLESRPPEALIQGLRSGDWSAGGGLFFGQTVTDFAEGALEHTGNSLDVAVKGKGFFAVSDGENTFYTRAGNFSIDPDGFLVTTNGKYRVLNDAGQPINVRGGEVEISRDGSVFVSQGDTVEGRGVIGVVTFDEVEAGGTDVSKVFEHVGESLYRYHGKLAREGEGTIAQGFLEQSTVSVVEELVSMMEGFRAYEANMMALRNQDATLQRAVTQVGKVSQQ